MFMDILKLVDEARDSIGEYCMNSCKAKCCKRGKLAVNEEQAKFIIKNKKIKTENKSGLTIINLDNICPALKDNKCSVYDKRPQSCRDYPLFYNNNMLFADAKCEAVQKGMFEEFLKKIEKMGIKII